MAERGAPSSITRVSRTLGPWLPLIIMLGSPVVFALVLLTNAVPYADRPSTIPTFFLIWGLGSIGAYALLFLDARRAQNSLGTSRQLVPGFASAIASAALWAVGLFPLGLIGFWYAPGVAGWLYGALGDGGRAALLLIDLFAFLPLGILLMAVSIDARLGPRRAPRIRRWKTFKYAIFGAGVGLLLVGSWTWFLTPLPPPCSGSFACTYANTPDPVSSATLLFFGGLLTLGFALVVGLSGLLRRFARSQAPGSSVRL